LSSFYGLLLCPAASIHHAGNAHLLKAGVQTSLIDSKAVPVEILIQLDSSWIYLFCFYNDPSRKLGLLESPEGPNFSIPLSVSTAHHIFAEYDQPATFTLKLRSECKFVHCVVTQRLGPTPESASVVTLSGNKFTAERDFFGTAVSSKAKMCVQLHSKCTKMRGYWHPRFLPGRRS